MNNELKGAMIMADQYESLIVLGTAQEGTGDKMISIMKIKDHDPKNIFKMFSMMALAESKEKGTQEIPIHLKFIRDAINQVESLVKEYYAKNSN